MIDFNREAHITREVEVGCSTRVPGAFRESGAATSRQPPVRRQAAEHVRTVREACARMAVHTYALRLCGT
jgi:hypothetical protein